MDAFFTILGVAGSVLCILMYFLLERGKARASDIWYYACNGLGAFLILLAAMRDFDGGDLGAITQELCWVTISGIGVWKLVKQRRKNRNEGF
jgi:hypothetical protein